MLMLNNHVHNLLLMSDAPDLPFFFERFTLDLADSHAKPVQRNPTSFAPFVKPETPSSRSSDRVGGGWRNYPEHKQQHDYFEKESTQKLLYPGGIAAMQRGWCMATDQQCDPQFVRIISPNGVVTTCGQGRADFSNGAGQAACFNEPLAIAALTDGTSCVVSERGRHCIGLRVVTTDCVASPFAGTGAEGNQDGAFDTATFTDLFSVAVDIDNNVVAADVGKAEEALADRLTSEPMIRHTRLRVLDHATKQVATLQDGQYARGAEGVAGGSPLLLPSYPHVTIDDCGSIWCAHAEGVDIITGITGLNKGHHAWSNLMWEPTGINHTFLCTPKAKEAVYTILAICARTFVETTPRDGETVWLLPELPIEVWHYILSMIQINKLGAPLMQPPRCGDSSGGGDSGVFWGSV